MKSLKYFVSGLIISIASFNCHNPVSTENNYTKDGHDLDNIFVSSPSSGAVWKPGNEYEIKWTAMGNIKKVNLILLKKKQYYKIIIADKIESKRRYSWLIPENIPGSVSYQIKIENSDEPELFYYSEYFEISDRE